MKSDYYTYAFLREDGTPYYIGKGRGKRAFRTDRTISRPPRERILFLKKNLTEGEAFRHEIYMIAVFGRKDKGTGILWNFTDGGEGVSGRKVSEETREKMRQAQLGHKVSEEAREKLRQFHLGRKASPQTKRKMSKSKIGKAGIPHTEETKEKLRQKALLQWERKRMEGG